MADFYFSNNLSSSQTAGVINLLRRPRLWIPTERDYPRHDEWLEKTEAAIAKGTKRAMVAYIGSTPYGAVVYRQSPETPDTLEIRNITVAPEARGRHFGAYLLRNSEIEGISNDYKGITKILVDTKVTNYQMIQFLDSQGYCISRITDLYQTNTGLDAVLVKNM